MEEKARAVEEKERVVDEKAKEVEKMEKRIGVENLVPNGTTVVQN